MQVALPKSFDLLVLQGVHDEHVEIEIGFPVNAPPRLTTNPYGDDLVYFQGGEAPPVDVVDFPRFEKRMIRVGRDLTVFPVSAGAKLFRLGRP
jgi:hypothetical protein